MEDLGYRYSILPTSLLPVKKDQRGRYFSISPCDICGTEGIKFEVTRHVTATHSHLSWLLTYNGIPYKEDDYVAPTLLAHKRYTCSESCATLYILSGKHEILFDFTKPENIP